MISGVGVINSSWSDDIPKTEGADSLDKGISLFDDWTGWLSDEELVDDDKFIVCGIVVGVNAGIIVGDSVGIGVGVAVGAEVGVGNIETAVWLL